MFIMLACWRIDEVELTNKVKSIVEIRLLLEENHYEEMGSEEKL